NAKPRRRLRRWGLGAAGGMVLLVALVAAGMQWTARARLPGYVHAQLQQLLGRPAAFRVINAWPVGAFTIHDLVVPPKPPEAEAPRRARAAQVHISWPDLVRKRQVRVTRVDLFGLQVTTDLDLRAGRPLHPTLNERLVELGRTGLELVTVKDATLRLAATLP